MTLFDDYPPDASPKHNPEEAVRDEILADLATRNADVLAWLRRRLVLIYRVRCEDVGREAAYVTADDARRIIDAMPEFRGRCLNFLGALFKAPGWRAAGGFHKSATPGSHANRLMKWRWVGN